MPKTIVCIIENDMTMNYLFVKEQYQPNDDIILITQFREISIAKQFSSLFGKLKDSIRILSLNKDGDEDLWDTICLTLKANIKNNCKYVVNLSGGTRLMSIAVQHVFEPLGAKFYFMPIDRNAIIHSHIDNEYGDNSDKVVPIKHKLTIEEYMRVNGVRCHHKEPLLSKEYSTDFFTLFTQNILSDVDYDIIEKLRDMRNRNIDTDTIDGLDEFLDFINFPLSHKGKLSSSEIQYLTGNWFEEYIYYLVKDLISPTDIAIGVDIQRIGSQNHNDLDVVFTLNNRLFAIECKTGVGRTSLYNQMVYKACALKESLLGLRSYTYIFALNDDHKDHLSQTARNMGVTFCDKEMATDHAKLKNLLLNTKMYI